MVNQWRPRVYTQNETKACLDFQDPLQLCSVDHRWVPGRRFRWLSVIEPPMHDFTDRALVQSKKIAICTMGECSVMSTAIAYRWMGGSTCVPVQRPGHEEDEPTAQEKEQNIAHGPKHAPLLVASIRAVITGQCPLARQP